MTNPLSSRVFTVANGVVGASSYERCLARDLRLPESWMRDAIFSDPALVAEPCRAAGLPDEDWYPWAREFSVGVGSIDVLLLSSQGRVAIVETKLVGNPELRRQVLAQALDYLTDLPDAIERGLPAIPRDESGDPVADIEDIRESVQDRNVLVVIASDRMDARAVRLTTTLLGSNLTRPWDLVLIDLALFRHKDASMSWLIVPCVRGLVVAEVRQVVKVVVEGESPKARVEVVRYEAEDEERPARQRWNETQFFEQLKSRRVPQEIMDLALDLRDLASAYPESASLVWGTGRTGSMVFKRAGHGLVELYGSGQLRFRTGRFERGLGDEVGGDYLRTISELFPEGVQAKYVPAENTARNARALFGALSRAMERVDGPRESNVG